MHRIAVPVVLILFATSVTSGCISHVARIDAGSAPAEGVVGAKFLDPIPATTTSAGALPQDVPVSAWHVDEDGGLERFEGRCRTPLPWWQRFPADIVTDFLPSEHVASATLVVAPTPVAPMDPAALAAAAHRAGYAAPDAP